MSDTETPSGQCEWCDWDFHLAAGNRNEKTKQNKKKLFVSPAAPFLRPFHVSRRKATGCEFTAWDTFNRATVIATGDWTLKIGLAAIKPAGAGLPDCRLTLSLPAVAPYRRGGDGRDGDAADGGRHLHLEHLAAPRLVGGAVRQRVLHGVAELMATGEATSVIESGKHR